MSLLDFLTPRRALGAVFLSAVAAMGGGYYVQHVVGLEPCPLCIVQRMFFVLAGLLAALGAVFGVRRWIVVLSGVGSALMALAGGGVAVWHSWLIAYPPEWVQCGRPFAWMLENNSLVTLLPKIFEGEGDCLRADWFLLGLNIPQCAAVLFAGMVALAVWAIVRSLRTTAR